MATKQVIFKLGNEEYGMDISLVTTISGYTGVVPIPNAPACIIGILNLRGDVIPVYSLRKKFRMPEVEVTEGTQLLVTKCNNMQVGYKVDSVSGIIAIEEESICAMPVIVKTRETSYAMGVANQKDRLVVLLDIPHILSEQEAEAVKEFAEENERAEEKKKEEQKKKEEERKRKEKEKAAKENAEKNKNMEEMQEQNEIQEETEKNKEAEE